MALGIAAAAALAGAQDHQGDHAKPGASTMPVAVSQEAHTHGIAELLVVLEAEQLEIELLSPAVNLLGFEGAASSPEQHSEVINARNTLQDAENLFQTGPAQCRLTGHDVDFGGLITGSDVHTESPVTEKHGDTHHGYHNQARTHSHIRANYRYRCGRPKELASMSIQLQSRFHGIQSLQVQWIVNGRQGMAALDHNSGHLVFR